MIEREGECPLAVCMINRDLVLNFHAVFFSSPFSESVKSHVWLLYGLQERH